MSVPSCARKIRVLTLAIGVICSHSASAIEPTADVIEYYNASLNHFFFTAYADEAAMLDQGIMVKGWTRTGVSWSEARAATGAKRQIFFVQLGSLDTHGDQINRQQALFAELSPALKAFYDATVALGVSAQVTTFTLSWGNHRFIIGDSVRGGSMYGQYPQLVLKGPSDAEAEGRWLPTASVDQYGATLARWFGVASADLSTVFTNVAKFSTSDLGFMS